MTADASQLPVPLGWYLGICGFVFLACTVVWLCGGAEKADRALVDLPTDDDASEGVCTDPECACEQGRARYDGYVRLQRAMDEHAAWQDRLRAVARADAEQVQQ